jgi:hypothetical protein
MVKVLEMERQEANRLKGTARKLRQPKKITLRQQGFTS